jgi:hypothetical protein
MNKKGIHELFFERMLAVISHYCNMKSKHTQASACCELIVLFW